MTFNKIEAGMMKLTKVNVPIQPYVNDVVNTFAAEARAKGIEIEIRDVHLTATDKSNFKTVRDKEPSIASAEGGQSITNNKSFNSDKDKAKEKGRRSRWAAAQRRLVSKHVFNFCSINMYEINLLSPY